MSSTTSTVMCSVGVVENVSASPSGSVKYFDTVSECVVSCAHVWLGIPSDCIVVFYHCR